jgi:DNA-directed RNA polymerase specialized sigma24 family protein
MNEAKRSVLIERIWHGNSFAEIGARRNCTADAARHLWIRAVREMRNLLAQNE